MTEKREMKFVAGKAYKMVPLEDVVASDGGFSANSKIADWSSLESFAVELPTAYATVQWMGKPGESGEDSNTEGKYIVSIASKPYKEMLYDDDEFLQQTLAQLEDKVRSAAKADDIQVEALTTKFGKTTLHTVPFEGDLETLVGHMQTKLKSEYWRACDGALTKHGLEVTAALKEKADQLGDVGVSQVKELTQAAHALSEAQLPNLDEVFRGVTAELLETLSQPHVLAGESQKMRANTEKKEPAKLLPDGPSKPKASWLDRLTGKREQTDSVGISL